MTDYQHAEQELLLGVLEALPCPAVLLNRFGETGYVNGRPCPIDLETVAFAALPEVKTALQGISQTAIRTKLHGENGAASGILELYPVRPKDIPGGALLLFRPDPVRETLTVDALPTVSRAMSAVWERLSKLALLNTPALFLGEPGVGKADFARALHDLSNPQKGHRSFITAGAGINPGKLRELARAAGNGALLFRRIDRWTGELLEEANTLYASRQIGHGAEAVPLNARLMASAGTDLPDRVARGEFPEDLFARMRVMPVVIPALRDRPEDIMPAAERYANAAAARMDKSIDGFSEEAREALLRQPWKGNLEELARCVEAAVSQSPGGLILASYLDTLCPPDTGSRAPLRHMRDAYGRDRVIALLKTHGNSVAGKKKAAAELGISLATLYRILGSRKQLTMNNEQ